MKKVFETKGISMEPIIFEGDKVHVEVLGDTLELKRFDIIVYISSTGSHLCHYFWKINSSIKKRNKKIVVTRPLNPIGAYDTPVTEDQIIGRITNHNVPLFLKLRILFILIRKKLFNT